MKYLMVIFALFGFSNLLSAQKVDTTYYDKNWRVVKFKELSDFVRYDFIFNDQNYDNKSRIFFIGGQLEREGTPLIVNKLDGTKSKWRGELTAYARNGAKLEVSNYNNEGNLHGTSEKWDENGQALSEENFQNGVLHGLSINYPPEQPEICYVTQFENGKPVNNEMSIKDKSGKMTKVDFYTHKIITREPKQSDCKNIYKDGVESCYYDMNGILVALSCNRSNSYGKYYQCFIRFFNDTFEPVEINPDNISGQYCKGDNRKPIELMPADEYLAKIARNQALIQALAGFSSGMSTYNAGYSTSTTTGTAVGTGGWATGSSVTTTYNAHERQAILDNEQQKMQNLAEENVKEKEAVDGSILKRTLVEPGSELLKTFYVKYLSADMLSVNLEINGFNYTFNLKLSK